MHQEENNGEMVHIPSPWPHYVLLILGIFALGAGILSWVQLSAVSADVEAISRTLEQVDEGGGDEQTIRALVKQRREVLRVKARWGRRRLGCFLLTGLLLLGSFFASGLHGLHRKMKWQERDVPPPWDDTPPKG